MNILSFIRKTPLLIKVLIAIILGLLCSLFFPLWLTRGFVTINSVIGNFIGMFEPVLILGLISSWIADLGKGAGYLTTVLAYISTIQTGGFSYGVCNWVYPFLLGSDPILGTDAASQSALTPYFTIDIPAFIDVMTALVVAFILGISMISDGNGPRYHIVAAMDSAA